MLKNKVKRDLVSGLNGEVAQDVPVVAVAASVASDTAKNLFGCVYTYKNGKSGEVVVGGDVANFAGVAVLPKAYAGNTGTIEKGSIIELLQGGEIFANVEAEETAAAINGKIYYDETNGQLSTNEDLTEIVGAKIVRIEPAAADDAHLQLCVVRFTA